MSDLKEFSGEKKNRMLKALMLGDATSLKNLDEFAEFLNGILHGPYSVSEFDGELCLIHIRALVERIDGLRIEIYPDEHPPPHFHVKSANINASFTIDDCSRIEGDVSGSDERKIKYWHKHSKAILIEKWDEMRPTECSVGSFRGE